MICNLCNMKIEIGFCTNPTCENSLSKKVEFLFTELNKIRNSMTMSRPAKPTICIQCCYLIEKVRASNIYDTNNTCGYKDIAITDFITGETDPALINFGDCKYFKAKK